MTTNATNPPTGWITEREANDALGLNSRYGLLNRRRAGSPVPEHVRIGRRYFYNPASVALFDPWKTRRESHRSEAFGKIPTYGAVHRRMQVANGSAKGHNCELCGAPGAHYAFLGDAPQATLIQPDGKDAGLPYSLDPNVYAVACRVDAAALDKHPNRRRVADGVG